MLFCYGWCTIWTLVCAKLRWSRSERTLWNYLFAICYGWRRKSPKLTKHEVIFKMLPPPAVPKGPAFSFLIY